MSKAIEPNDFNYIRELVREKSAIVLDDGKEYLVETRLAGLVREHDLPNIAALVQEMKRAAFGAIHAEVIDAMTTNETSFFRDVSPFDALKTEVLPRLIESRKSRKTLNIWCSASSSGQEPYTIVMVIKEHFPELADWTINFVASDISTAMIARCKEGIYSQLEVNRGLPAMMLVKYFVKDGAHWRIKEDLRKMIQFRNINLCADWPMMPKLDFIFCRNVLIYFDVETKRTILGKMRGMMTPDGFLFLGGAETTINIDENFERLPIGRTGCYQLKEAA